MFNQMQDFMTEQMQAFTGRAQQLKDDPLAALREGVAYSAGTVEALKQPVRFAARSGAQLSSLTHQTAQDLIELQAHMITSSLTDIAAGLERAAQAKDFSALVSGHSEALQRSAGRLAHDATRAMEIITAAGRGAQQVAAETYERLSKPAEAATPRTHKTRHSGKAKTQAD
jgi:phasin family protein